MCSSRFTASQRKDRDIMRTITLLTPFCLTLLAGTWGCGGASTDEGGQSGEEVARTAEQATPPTDSKPGENVGQAKEGIIVAPYGYGYGMPYGAYGGYAAGYSSGYAISTGYATGYGYAAPYGYGWGYGVPCYGWGYPGYGGNINGGYNVPGPY
jgi:hypothetical protein